MKDVLIRWKRPLVGGILALLAGVAGLWLGLGPLADWLVPDVATRVLHEQAFDSALLDRHGSMLRLFPDKCGDFHLSIPAASFPQNLCSAVLAAEDKRFFQHSGFDPLAILRAASQNIRHQRVVSGASTISQQLIRIVYGGARGWNRKIREVLRAIRLERQIKKTDILGAYLNLAPLGGNIRGFGLAAWLYFGKNVESLNISESALLAAVPQMPSRMNPRVKKSRRRLFIRRNWIIRRMAQLRLIPRKEALAAQKRPLGLKIRKLPCLAPHFVDWTVTESGMPKGMVMSSIDLDLQKTLEQVIHSHASRLARAGARQASGLIIDTRTMEIRAMLGSLDYGKTNAGFNNGCLAPRSGGSILKPLLYALAMESGYGPTSIIPDTHQTFRTPDGDYLPYNADRRTYGPVTIRSALGNSLNISAVKMLNELGIRKFGNLLVDLGVLKPTSGWLDRFGLGLAIGNPEIRMIDLAAAYGMFVHRGSRVFIRRQPGDLISGASMISPEAAYLVLDILSDPSARLLTFGNPKFFKFSSPVALKTGTSTNYRDCWLGAMTPKYLIFLWVGNFDGSPTYGLSGSTACGPILQNLMGELVREGDYSWFSCPPDVTEISVCGISGASPGPYCDRISRELLIRGREPPPVCQFHSQPGGAHQLPVEYADWLSQRRERRVPDPYELAGGVKIADPMLMLLQDPHEKSGVRLIGSSTAIVSSGTEKVGPDAPSKSVPSVAGTATGTAVVTAHPALLVVREPESAEGLFGRLNIVSPHNGDRFVMAPGGDNLIKLRAIPDVPVAEIIWLIDGKETARTPPPFETFWQLHRGDHQIMAVGPGDQAALIRISVD